MGVQQHLNRLGEPTHDSALYLELRRDGCAAGADSGIFFRGGGGGGVKKKEGAICTKISRRRGPLDFPLDLGPCAAAVLRKSRGICTGLYTTE